MHKSCGERFLPAPWQLRGRAGVRVKGVLFLPLAGSGPEGTGRECPRRNCAPHPPNRTGERARTVLEEVLPDWPRPPHRTCTARGARSPRLRPGGAPSASNRPPGRGRRWWPGGSPEAEPSDRRRAQGAPRRPERGAGNGATSHDEPFRRAPSAIRGRARAGPENGPRTRVVTVRASSASLLGTGLRGEQLNRAPGPRSPARLARRVPGRSQGTFPRAARGRRRRNGRWVR